MDIRITPSLMLEYMFCQRFIYFMLVLSIDQNEDERYKVLEGREVHKKKALTNIDYMRKKIGVVKKETECHLYSEKYSIYGIVDELLFLNDGTASPLDYKYAEYKNKLFKTYKMQSLMYSLMIQENYSVAVNKGYIVYTRSKNYIDEIVYTNKDYDVLIKSLDDIKIIVGKNYFPKKTNVKIKCIDCCYRNVCVK